MRGARSQNDGHGPHPRIIPADAGSTCLRFGIGSALGDHPRGCGEHRRIKNDDFVHEGSSPRMRGARLGIWRIDVSIGIIPADAGSTQATYNGKINN